MRVLYIIFDFTSTRRDNVHTYMAVFLGCGEILHYSMKLLPKIIYSSPVKQRTRSDKSKCNRHYVSFVYWTIYTAQKQIPDILSFQNCHLFVLLQAKENRRADTRSVRRFLIVRAMLSGRFRELQRK